MRTSVENEWLCARLLEQFGIPVPKSEIQVFGEQKVLVVERFDRRYVPEQGYWLRIPQEDFCQVTGAPSSHKYERDGGPGMKEIARLLQGSENPDEDLDIFIRTQILFWMLAATDGHAKNFSIALQAGGRFRLTPIYDVLSVWSIVGTGPNKLDYQKQRMAMAWSGDKNRHYRLRDVQRRHLVTTAKNCGYGAHIENTLQELVAQTPKAIEAVSMQLPANFPQDVFESITGGLRTMASKL
jgi:serine/threonine-protein kinase HipA